MRTQAGGMKRCENCGTYAISSAVLCPTCNASFGTRPLVNPAVKASSTPPQVKAPPLAPAPTPVVMQVPYQIPQSCPTCGASDVRAISGVIAAGNTTNSSMGVAYGARIGGVSGVGFSVSTTELARRFAPPRPIPQRSGCLAALCGIASLFAFLMLMASIGSMQTSAAGAFAYLVAFLLGLGVAVWLFGRAKAESVGLTPHNQQIVNDNARRQFTWERSFYCQKCDTVFDPATQNAVKSAEAFRLWS